jgi:hypothetical protein
VGTVKQDAKLDFEFQEVTQSEVPRGVSQQYPEALISWCFAKNSLGEEPDSEETTNRCNALVPSSPARPGTTH